jgi:hypothetical protein
MDIDFIERRKNHLELKGTKTDRDNQEIALLNQCINLRNDEEKQKQRKLMYAMVGKYVTESRWQVS